MRWSLLARFLRNPFELANGRFKLSQFGKPPEVSDYLVDMTRRVNTAYAALEAPQQVAKQAAVYRAEPIYTSPVRAWAGMMSNA